MIDVTNQPGIPPRVHRFAAATSDALTALVLQDCLLGTSSAQSQTSQSEFSRSEALASAPVEGLTSIHSKAALQELSVTDDGLKEWLSHVSTSANVIQALRNDTTWRDQQSPASERLWQTLQLVARLQTLQQQFDEALAHRLREAIYHFAYGLSHELNNPLANIATRAGVLLQSEVAKDRQRLLETVIDNAMRGSEMLGDLMLLARPPKLTFEPVQIAKWFAAFVERAGTWAARQEVELRATSDCAMAQFRFDPVAIREALWCLVRNAIEASSGGAIVELEMTEVEGGLEFRVCDAGAGLSPEALQYCFDPYYSGREAGRGLGLGLSKALRIAELHRSQLRLSNRQPRGCEATLRLQANE